MVFHESIFLSIPNTIHTPFVFPNFPLVYDSTVKNNSSLQSQIQSSISSTNPDITNLRRSERIKHSPTYLQNYFCGNLTNKASASQASPSYPSSGKPILHFVSNSKLSTKYKAFVFAVSSIFEPKTFKQAISQPQWQNAMAYEIKALDLNKT